MLLRLGVLDELGSPAFCGYSLRLLRTIRICVINHILPPEFDGFW
jgi:hypothetical protein